MCRSNTFRANVFNKNKRLTFHLGTHWHCLPSQVFVCIHHDSRLVVKFVPWSTLGPENIKINIHIFFFYWYTSNRKHGQPYHFGTFFSKTRNIQTCCSSVMVVWTRMFPCSHGSGMPADPGKKKPAAKSCKALLKPEAMKNVNTIFFQNLSHDYHRSFVSNKSNTTLISRSLLTWRQYLLVIVVWLDCLLYSNDPEIVFTTKYDYDI